MAVLTSDTFTDRPSTFLNGSSANLAGGGSAATWATSGSWPVNSLGMLSVPSTAGPMAVLAISEDDYRIDVEQPSGYAQNSYTAIARYTDDDNFYGLRGTIAVVMGPGGSEWGTTWVLWKRVAGVDTTIEAFDDTEYPTTFALEVSGTSLAVYSTGRLLFATEDATHAAGDPGIYAGGGAAYVASFSVADPVLFHFADPDESAGFTFLADMDASVATPLSAGSPASEPAAYGPEHAGAPRTVVDVGSPASGPEAFGPETLGSITFLAAGSAVRGPHAFGPFLELEGEELPDIAAHVFRRENLVTPVMELDEAFARRFYDQLNEVGSGSLELLNDDPQLPDIEDDDVIRFSIRGRAAMSILAREWRRVSVAGGEEAEQTTTISGPGHLAVLEEAVVYPAGGWASLPVDEDRIFSWQSPEYDDAAWEIARAMTTVEAAQLGAWPHQPMGVGFPAAAGAYMIWAPGSTNLSAPEGTCYLRGTYTSATAGKHKMYALIDNYGTIYLDGVKLLEVSPHDGFTGAHTVVFEASAGEHTIAVQADNAVGYPDAHPAGVAIAIYDVDANNEPVTGNPVAVTGDPAGSTPDSNWRILAYPATPPGMTPGEALRHCIEEAQARGAIPGVVVGWTDELDSEGVAWPVVGDISTRVGTDVLTFARELSATYIDFWMEPASWTLRAYVHDGRGVNTDVVLSESDGDPDDGNLVALEQHKIISPSTVLLARYNGGWREVVRPADVRREALIGLGTTQSPLEVDRVANGQLDIYANVREAIQVGLSPTGDADTPYVAFRVGDVVEAPLMDGSPSAERVVAIDVAEHSDDTDLRYISFRPELKDVILTEQERFEQALKKMDAGTMRGDSKVATPVSIVFPRSGEKNCCGEEGEASWTITNAAIATNTGPSNPYYYDGAFTIQGIAFYGEHSIDATASILVELNDEVIREWEYAPFEGNVSEAEDDMDIAVSEGDKLVVRVLSMQLTSLTITMTGIHSNDFIHWVIPE